jgi:hypothetical protein
VSSTGSQPRTGPQLTPTWAPPGEQQPVPAKKPGLWTRFKALWKRAFSNLNLNGHTPLRVQPTIGEWGPEEVPTTKKKKRMRIYVALALPVTMLACFILGWFVYFLMTGCYGFGFGCREQ